MKLAINNIIPFKGFKAITIWPIIFVRQDCIQRYTVVDDRHEEIHGRQQLEMLITGSIIAVALFFLGCGWWSLCALPIFFVWYGIEYLIRLILYRNTKGAYRNISFEQEAYTYEAQVSYLQTRKLFEWITFLFKKNISY